MKRVSPWTIVLLLFVVETAAGQGQSGWRAGVASVPITPKEPIWLAGYGSRERPSGEVLQDLHAKALALEDETGAVSVLVTIDLLGLSRRLSDQIADRAWQEFGLSRDRLGLNFSHTHSGPVAGDVLRPAYPMEPEHLRVVGRYTSWVLDEIVKVIGQSMEQLLPARLTFGQGSAGFAVNRRRVRTGKRHLPGPVDHDVPVLAVRGVDGELRAVVFGYACHATVLSDYRINGDWPGFAQESVQEKHPGATALFVTGCGADANPLPRRSVDLARSYGQILAFAVDLVLDGEMAAVRGPLTTAFERVAIPFSKPPSRQELEARARRETGSRQRHARFLLERIEREGRLPDSYPYPISGLAVRGGPHSDSPGGRGGCRLLPAAQGGPRMGHGLGRRLFQRGLRLYSLPEGAQGGRLRRCGRHGRLRAIRPLPGAGGRDHRGKSGRTCEAHQPSGVKLAGSPGPIPVGPIRAWGRGAGSSVNAKSRRFRFDGLLILFVLTVMGACRPGGETGPPPGPPDLGKRELRPGLAARYEDGRHRVHLVTPTPNFYLEEGESLHPSLDPGFQAEWEGFLSILETGRYRFEGGGQLGGRR